jgi:hypothetical protein
MFYQIKNTLQMALFFALLSGTSNIMPMDNPHESTTQTDLATRQEKVRNLLKQEIGQGLEQKQLPTLRTKLSQLDRNTPEYQAQNAASIAWNASILPLWNCLQANNQKEEACQGYRNLYDQAWEKVESCDKILDSTPEKQALFATDKYSSYLCDFEYYQSALKKEIDRKQSKLVVTERSLDANKKNLERLEPNLSNMSKEHPGYKHILSQARQEEKDLQENANETVALRRSIKVDVCALSKMNNDHKKRLEYLFKNGLFPEEDIEYNRFQKSSSKYWIREMYESCAEKVRLEKE